LGGPVLGAITEGCHTGKLTKEEEVGGRFENELNSKHATGNDGR
jgi:hypothetical protein